MALRDGIATITGGDQAKLARLTEILSWFHNDWEVAATVAKYLRDSERGEIYSRDGVQQESVESIENLLWAMEQTNSEEQIVRRRWWAYRSKIEHPEDDPTIRNVVPFVRVLFQAVPPEGMHVICNRRPFLRAMSLPRCSPWFPRRSPHLNGSDGVKR
ncbi:uncharacterized protein LOC123396310 [Hordeum vulgare subsp. vulgare]|uniref:uncharacterized protein LOC123396310 n=1 Tax=Hordeum vulgare subsp. vulgare TaxID=112509 RepID=UPI001D1A41BB|nr:uncharacterized protein LOC123396310 [Hordeum vulgare subsp. vulgare]